MGEPLCHGSHADAEWLFPHGVTGDVFESFALVEPDDVTGEVYQMANPGRPNRNVFAVDRRHPARRGDPGQFAHNESIMIKELVVAGAVRQVAVVAAVVVQPGERRTVN